MLDSLGKNPLDDLLSILRRLLVLTEKTCSARRWLELKSALA